MVDEKKYLKNVFSRLVYLASFLPQYPKQESLLAGCYEAFA